MTLAKYPVTVSVNNLTPLPCEFSSTTERIDVTSAIGTREPDTQWSFVDGAGHYHAWARREAGLFLPTLYRRLGKRAWRCNVCDAKVAPGYTARSASSGREYIPGLTEYRIRAKPLPALGAAMLISTPRSERVSVRLIAPDVTMFGTGHVVEPFVIVSTDLHRCLIAAPPTLTTDS